MTNLISPIAAVPAFNLPANARKLVLAETQLQSEISNALRIIRELQKYPNRQLEIDILQLEIDLCETSLCNGFTFNILTRLFQLQERTKKYA